MLTFNHIGHLSKRKSLATVFTYRGQEGETRCNLGPSECETEGDQKCVRGLFIKCQWWVISRVERFTTVFEISLPRSLILLMSSCWDPLALHKNMPSFSLHFFPQAPSLSFHPKISLLAAQTLVLHLSFFFFCPFLYFLDFDDEIISVKIWYTTHLTLVLLQKACEEINIIPRNDNMQMMLLFTFMTHRSEQ